MLQVAGKIVPSALKDRYVALNVSAGPSTALATLATLGVTGVFSFLFHLRSHSVRAIIAA